MPVAAEELRACWRRFRPSPGWPPLGTRLRFALALEDRDDPGFTVECAEDWTVTVAELDAAVVHDGALATSGALALAVCTGAADPGDLTVHGVVTGTLASQSVLAFLLEQVAAPRAPGDGRAVR